MEPPTVDKDGTETELTLRKVKLPAFRRLGKLTFKAFPLAENDKDRVMLVKLLTLMSFRYGLLFTSMDPT